MAELKLDPRWQTEAYDQVKSDFEEGNLSCVVAPTGSGKSIMGIKLFEDNPNEQILYVSPSIVVNTQIRKSVERIYGKPFEEVFPNVTFHTYSSLSRMEETNFNDLNPGIAVYDEIHRAGAETWQFRAKEMLEKNENLKALGVTATPIRTDGRNMADELFGGVSYELKLTEAIAKEILPVPIFVSSRYISKDEVTDLQEKINKIPDETERMSFQKRYDEWYEKNRNNLGKAQGIGEILTKYEDEIGGKALVFCKNIDHMDEMVSLCEGEEGWFSNFEKDVDTIKISHLNGKEDNLDALQFLRKKPDEGQMKIAFACEMLNEGYHDSGLTTAIMARPTRSEIIFRQQLGRVLNRDGEKQPIVFDLANNLKYFKDFRYEVGKEVRKQEEKGKRTNRPNKNYKNILDKFKIMSEELEFVKEFEEIEANIKEQFGRAESMSLEQKIEELERYHEEIGEKITASTEYNGYNIGMWIQNLKQDIFTRGKEIEPDLKERFEKIGALDRERRVRTDNQQKLDYFKQFMEENPGEVLNDYSKLKDGTSIGQYVTAVIADINRGNVDESFVEEFKKVGVFSSKKEGIGMQRTKDVTKAILKYGSIGEMERLLKEGKITFYDIPDKFKDSMDFTMYYIPVDSEEQFTPKTKAYARLTAAIFGRKFGSNTEFEFFKMGSIDENLDTLTDREQGVLRLRFGMDDGESNDLETVGKVYNIMRERVRQIEAKALRKLRHPLRARKAEPKTREQLVEKYNMLYRFEDKSGENTRIYPSNFKNKSLEELDLSVRAYNTLTRHGVFDLKSLISLRNLEGVKLLGRKSLDEIVEVLEGEGISRGELGKSAELPSQIDENTEKIVEILGYTKEDAKEGARLLWEEIEACQWAHKRFVETETNVLRIESMKEDKQEIEQAEIEVEESVLDEKVEERQESPGEIEVEEKTGEVKEVPVTERKAQEKKISSRRVEKEKLEQEMSEIDAELAALKELEKKLMKKYAQKEYEYDLKGFSNEEQEEQEGEGR